MYRGFTTGLTGILLVGTIVPVQSVIAADRGNIETIEVTGRKIGSLLESEISTATRLGLSVLETPQSISVISREQMNNMGLDSLNDALRTTTGVQVEAVETDRTYYTARGFDVTNFQLDGIGMPAAYGNINGDIDTAVYERIEVVRGANGLMTGAGNPSATINRIRKRPTEDFQASVSATAGSWDKARVDADISGPLGESLGGRLVVAREDRESWLDLYAQEKNVVYGVLAMDLGPATTLTAGVNYQDTNTDSPLWGALPLYYTDGTQTDYDESATTSADWAYWDNTRTNAFAELEHRFNERWTVRAVYQHKRHEGDSEMFYMYSSPDPVTDVGLIGYASAYDVENKRELWDLYLTGAFDFAGREHELVFGINWTETELTNQSLYDFTSGNGFPWIGDFTRWDGNTPYPTFGGSPTGADFSDEQKAIYGAGRFKLTERLSLITGARVVDWDSEGASYGVDQATEASGKTLPYAGLVYQIREELNAYASYTETFMPQNELGADLRRLAPTEGINSELGLKGAFLDGRLSATLAVFKTEHENLAESRGFDPDTGEQVYIGRDYESEGYEVELVAELAEGLNASLGYTDLEIEDDNGDDARTFIPRKVLKVATRYQPPALKRLLMGASVNWQDDIYREQDNAPGITEQESYSLVNAFASYRFTESFSATVNINNITDEKYINSLYWDQGYYGAPRNVSVSVDWRY